MSEIETIGGDLPGSEEATPQEQFDKDEVVTRGMDMIYTEEDRFTAAAKFLESGAQNPADALATLTALIMGQLDDTAENGIPEAALIPAAAEILGELGEIAQASGAFEADEPLMNAAMQNLIVKIAEEYGVDEEEIAGLMDGLDESVLQNVATQQEQYAVARAPAQDPGVRNG